MLRLLVTANVVHSSLILALLMELLRSSETQDLTRSTWRNIPENGIPHRNYIALKTSDIIRGLVLKALRVDIGSDKWIKIRG
jgi:hypothetical protein